MRIGSASLILPLGLMAAPACADDSQFWLTVAGDMRIDADTQLTADAILRSRPDRIEAGQTILRVGVRQQVAPSVSVQIAYAFVDSFVDGGRDRVEHRLSQTAALDLGHLGPARIDARAGLEQRLPSGGGEMGLRTRARVRAGLPLGKAATLQLSEEAIAALNSTAWGQRSGLSATRTGASVRLPVSDGVGVSPGYTWQHIVLRGAPDRDDHVFGLTLDAHF